MNNTPKINDGGAAFPDGSTARHEGYATTPGMSLRDYFAGQALAGLMACTAVRAGLQWDDYAKDSYRYADAMIAARKAGAS